jgi:hypothetical protein
MDTFLRSGEQVQAGAVGERADAVADPAVDLAQGLLDGAGRTTLSLHPDVSTQIE